MTEQEVRALQRIARLQRNPHEAPESTIQLAPGQLASMVRLRDAPRKVAVSVRLDPQVLAWLKSQGAGHLTRINDILLNLMEAECQSR